MLPANGMTCNMSRTDNCWDNESIRSFFVTLKAELERVFATHAKYTPPACPSSRPVRSKIRNQCYASIASTPGVIETVCFGIIIDRLFDRDLGKHGAPST